MWILRLRRAFFSRLEIVATAAGVVRYCDTNKLHDLKASLDRAQVYSPDQVNRFVELFLRGGERDQLDPILGTCVAVYVDRLDEDGQVDFKSKAKAFCRTYGFLSSIIPYSNSGWEKLSILLNLLTPKLPAPVEEDLAQGILDAIDMDSYRVEKKAVQQIALEDTDAEIEPTPHLSRSSDSQTWKSLCFDGSRQFCANYCRHVIATESACNRICYAISCKHVRRHRTQPQLPSRHPPPRILSLRRQSQDSHHRQHHSSRPSAG